MFYSRVTLADITVEQYYAMSRAIQIECSGDKRTGRVSPALWGPEICAEESFKQLVAMRLIRFEDCLRYILTPEGLYLMELVEGFKIKII